VFLGRAEADVALARRRAHFDIGDPRARDADPTTTPVGEPEHRLVGERPFDLTDDRLSVGVLGKLDLELLHRLDDPDANLHGVSSLFATRVALAGMLRDVWHNAAVDPRGETDRSRRWASTMRGFDAGDVVLAHETSTARVTLGDPARDAGLPLVDRRSREARERSLLAPEATRADGGGHRRLDEEPDDFRTCFERDRDRILHSTAFRRLAGKTQVFVFPEDHQRTRLTHALEVAQIAGGIARAVGLNVALVEAIALGHDCGHGPGGHASEDALDPYVVGGFDHAPWGAEVSLATLNLCDETLDGIANHSWSRPAPHTPEGEVVSWADRIGYVCHDFEDAVSAGIVKPAELPDLVAARCGTRRGEQIGAFIDAMVATVAASGVVGMVADEAEALAAFRAFNYERIYLRDESVEQGAAVVAVLRALVDYFAEHPDEVPEPAPGRTGDPTLEAVRYVAGMTDRFAFHTAVEVLGWPAGKLPRGIDR
jgi:dGTPase